MAETATSKLAAAKGAATTFLTKYKTPVIIVVVILVAAGIYYFVFRKPEGFYAGQQYHMNGRHPGARGRYPGREGFFDQMTETDAEGFYDGTGTGNGMMAPNMMPSRNGGSKKLVLFYAPWCPHCKSLIEGDGAAWNALSRKYGGRKDLTIDQVNCDEKPEIATQYGIGGFPTIMLFVGDKTYTYDGDRSLKV